MYVELVQGREPFARVGRHIPARWRGRGLGLAFLKMAEEAVLKHTNLPELRADTVSPRAVKTYIKAGWEKFGEDRGVLTYRKVLKR